MNPKPGLYEGEWLSICQTTGKIKRFAAYPYNVSFSRDGNTISLCALENDGNEPKNTIITLEFRRAGQEK